MLLYLYMSLVFHDKYESCKYYKHDDDAHDNDDDDHNAHHQIQLH